MPELSLHSGPKMGFRPVQGPLPMPNFTFIAAEIWEYSPQTVKICNFWHKFAPQGRLVCRIIMKCLAFVPVDSSLLSFTARRICTARTIPWQCSGVPSRKAFLRLFFCIKITHIAAEFVASDFASNADRKVT